MQKVTRFRWNSVLEGFEIAAHIAPKYLNNIVEILRGNIVRLLKYSETYH